MGNSFTVGHDSVYIPILQWPGHDPGVEIKAIYIVKDFLAWSAWLCSIVIKQLGFQQAMKIWIMHKCPLKKCKHVFISPLSLWHIHYERSADNAIHHMYINSNKFNFLQMTIDLFISQSLNTQRWQYLYVFIYKYCT